MSWIVDDIPIEPATFGSRFKSRRPPTAQRPSAQRPSQEIANDQGFSRQPPQFSRQPPQQEQQQFSRQSSQQEQQQFSRQPSLQEQEQFSRQPPQQEQQFSRFPAGKRVNKGLHGQN